MICLSVRSLLDPHPSNVAVIADFNATRLAAPPFLWKLLYVSANAKFSSLRRRFMHLRPLCSVLTNPRAWWHFAARVVLKERGFSARNICGEQAYQTKFAAAKKEYTVRFARAIPCWYLVALAGTCKAITFCAYFAGLLGSEKDS